MAALPSRRNGFPDLEEEAGAAPADRGIHRVGVLSQYPAILESLGADPVAVFRKAGVALSDVASPDQSIGFDDFGRLLLAGEEETGLDYIGAMTGRRATLELLGPVGRLMRQAPTIGAAIADLVRNQPRYIRGAAVYSLVSGHRLILGYAVHQPATPGIGLIWDAVAAAGKSYLTELGAEPDRIEVMLPRPRPEKNAVWDHLVGQNIRYRSKHVGVALPLADLDTPVPGADPERRRAAEEGIRSYVVAQWPDLSGRLSREIRVKLMTGQDFSRQAMAEWAGLGIRTLNRRLDAEGTSYVEILSRTRREMALQLLQGSQLGLKEVAEALGYSQPSAFARAFRGWTGVTASDWRTGGSRVDLV